MRFVFLYGLASTRISSGLWVPLVRDCWIYEQVCVGFCWVLPGLTWVLWLFWALMTKMPLPAVKSCLVSDRSYKSNPDWTRETDTGSAHL